MKVKVGDLFGLDEALMELLKAEMPIGTGFKVNKMLQTVAPDIKNAYDQQNKLIAKYGKDGKVLITSEEWPEFQKESAELQATKVTVAIDKVTIPATAIVKGIFAARLEPFVEIEG